MYIDLQVPPYTISKSTTFYADVASNQNPFPLMCIDLDSYIVGAKLETSLNFHVTDGVHNLQIGRYSALAEDILFLMDVDKDYKQISLGAVSVFQGLNFEEKINRRRRGQVIIQNDCWIANGVTIMGGVTIHNGAIVAAKSVVTRDVPPYSVVAGNPARVIKYRYDARQILDLQRIAWWDWSQEKIKRNAELFHSDVSKFISEHIEDANLELTDALPLTVATMGGVRHTYLFVPDFYEPYPVYEKVIAEFNRHFSGASAEMLIYIEPDDRLEEHTGKLQSILQKHREHSCFITIITEKLQDERSLFKAADYYITTRAKENVRRMCLAELCNAECISGVDLPVFGFESTDKAAITVDHSAGRI